MANKQDHADKDSDICQPLPEKNSANTLDGQGEQQRPLAWPHLEKANHQHNQTGPDVEPPRQEKEVKTKKHLAA